MLESAKAAIPELPAERSARYEREFGLSPDTAYLFSFEPEWGDYFEKASAGGDPKATAIWVTELRSRDGASVEPGDLARLVALVTAKTVTAAAGRTILDKMVAEGGDPAEIAEREGLTAMEDSGELEAIVAKVIADNPDVVERIQGGNAKAMGALVGPVMRETKGRADGGEVNRLLRSALGL
jgi:aspartyl-tRNA(Asn)/glutamyl-tRNA(Gln) amidotransferase subunit B